MMRCEQSYAQDIRTNSVKPVSTSHRVPRTVPAATQAPPDSAAAAAAAAGAPLPCRRWRRKEAGSAPSLTPLMEPSQAPRPLNAGNT